MLPFFKEHLKNKKNLKQLTFVNYMVSFYVQLNVRVLFLKISETRMGSRGIRWRAESGMIGILYEIISTAKYLKWRNA